MKPMVSSALLRTQTDGRLVELAGAGQERAFEALVQRYRKPLLAYCRRLLLPEARAEEVVQQAFLTAWTALGDGAQIRELRPWLYRVTHNAAVNALKRSGYDYAELNEALHGADAPEADLERRTAIRQTLAAMASLPELQREALIRTAIEGHSHEQVATDLGLSGTVVRGLVYRARVSVRAAASALTPPQLAMWAASRMHGSPLRERVTELVAGGGSAGLATALIKGGAVVVAAGALATGTGALPVLGHSAAQAQTMHSVRGARRADEVTGPGRRADAGSLPADASAASTSSHEGGGASRAGERAGRTSIGDVPHGGGGGDRGSGPRPSERRGDGGVPGSSGDSRSSGGGGSGGGDLRSGSGDGGDGQHTSADSGSSAGGASSGSGSASGSGSSGSRSSRDSSSGDGSGSSGSDDSPTASTSTPAPGGSAAGGSGTTASSGGGPGPSAPALSDFSGGRSPSVPTASGSSSGDGATGPGDGGPSPGKTGSRSSSTAPAH